MWSYMETKRHIWWQEQREVGKVVERKYRSIDKETMAAHRILDEVSRLMRY